MALYNMNLENMEQGNLLRVGFGDPADNGQIVREVIETSKALAGQIAGKPLFINGPASLPVACVLAHAFCHIVPFVGIFDPKLAGYVVAVSHGGTAQVGDLVKL